MQRHLPSEDLMNPYLVHYLIDCHLQPISSCINPKIQQKYKSEIKRPSVACWHSRKLSHKISKPDKTRVCIKY